MRTKLVVLLLAFTFSTVSFAAKVNHDGGMYASVGLTTLNSEINAIGTDITNQLIEGRIGYRLNENFSVEGRGAFSISDDSVFGVSYEVDSYIGLYLRGEAPIGEKMNIYGYLGLVNVSSDVSGGGVPFVDDSGLSYGIGVDVKLSGFSSVGLEYMNLYDDNGVEITGFNIHYKRSF